MGGRLWSMVMSDRAEFEKFRDERNAALEREGHKPGSKWHVNNSHYQTWQAARAQGGQGAKPVARHHATVCYEDCLCEHGSGCKLEAECGAHPQPAQQGSVPEGQFMLPKEFLVEYRELVESSDYRPMHKVIRINAIDALLSTPTTPQPEGDGWIRCSDRLPAEADADCYGTIIGWDSIHDQAITMYPMAAKHR